MDYYFNKTQFIKNLISGVLLLVYVLLEFIYKILSIELVVSLLPVVCLLIYICVFKNKKLQILIPISFVLEIVLRFVFNINLFAEGVSFTANTIASKIISLLLWCTFCAIVILSYYAIIKNTIWIKAITIINFVKSMVLKVTSIIHTINYANDKGYNKATGYNDLILILVIGIAETILYYIALYILLPNAIEYKNKIQADVEK